MTVNWSFYRCTRARRFPTAGDAGGSFRHAWLALALAGSLLLAAALLIQLAG